MRDVLGNEDYATFHSALETGPHSAVHTAVSREVGDMGPFTSPNGGFIYPFSPFFPCFLFLVSLLQCFY